MYSLTSAWMYQFWLHSFSLAKNWSTGPITFNNGDSLPFSHNNREVMDFTTEAPSPADHYILGFNSPNMLGESPGNSASHGNRLVPSISSLCHWSIHIPDNSIAPFQVDMNGDSFRSALSESLETNIFTNISSLSLPFSLPLVA